MRFEKFQLHIDFTRVNSCVQLVSHVLKKVQVQLLKPFREMSGYKNFKISCVYNSTLVEKCAVAIAENR